MKNILLILLLLLARTATSAPLYRYPTEKSANDDDASKLIDGIVLRGRLSDDWIDPTKLLRWKFERGRAYRVPLQEEAIPHSKFGEPLPPYDPTAPVCDHAYYATRAVSLWRRCLNGSYATRCSEDNRPMCPVPPSGRPLFNWNKDVFGEPAWFHIPEDYMREVLGGVLKNR